MSARGVVSIAFANTGFVLLCTEPSEMLPPGGNDLIEVLEDYLAHLASQTRREVVFKILSDIEAVGDQAILALCISLHRMDVHWLIALVRVEMEPPTLNIKNSGHRFAIPLYGVSDCQGTPPLDRSAALRRLGRQLRQYPACHLLAAFAGFARGADAGGATGLTRTGGDQFGGLR